MTIKWRNPIRATYDWVLHWADRPSGPWALAGIAFAESSFFPIPPDILLIPMCLSAPHRAFRFATLCTISSVVGGMFGYLIGYAFFESVGSRLVEFYGLTDGIDQARTLYNRYQGIRGCVRRIHTDSVQGVHDPRGPPADQLSGFRGRLVGWSRRPFLSRRGAIAVLRRADEGVHRPLFQLAHTGCRSR